MEILRKKKTEQNISYWNCKVNTANMHTKSNHRETQKKKMRTPTSRRADVIIPTLITVTDPKTQSTRCYCSARSPRDALLRD